MEGTIAIRERDYRIGPVERDLLRTRSGQTPAGTPARPVSGSRKLAMVGRRCQRFFWHLEGVFSARAQGPAEGCRRVAAMTGYLPWRPLPKLISRKPASLQASAVFATSS